MPTRTSHSTATFRRPFRFTGMAGTTDRVTVDPLELRIALLRDDDDAAAAPHRVPGLQARKILRLRL